MIIFSISLVAVFHVSHGLIGGELATIRQCSHCVSIQVERVHICGGNVISDRHILTAAHCIGMRHGVQLVDVTILSGTKNCRDFLSGGTHQVGMVIAHPGYDNIRLEHDIAIYRTTSRMFFSGCLKSIALPTQNIPMRSLGKICGWGPGLGVLGNSSWLPSFIERLSMRVINDERCSELGGDNYRYQEFCCLAASGAGCSPGDSGSGLVFKKQLFGVLVRSALSRTIMPAMMIQVFHYIKWIRSIMERY